MASLNLDLNYLEHPKIVRLQSVLGRGAEVLPIRLWLYCGKFHCEDGRLAGYTGKEIEMILNWWGESGKMIEAFLRLRLLEEYDGGFAVHDWLDHAEHIIRYKEHGKLMRRKRLERNTGGSKEATIEEIPPQSKDSPDFPLENSPTDKSSTKNTDKNATSILQSAPWQGKAEQDRIYMAVQSKGVESAVATASCNTFVKGKFIFQLTDDEFLHWRNKIAGMLTKENEYRVNNKFAWTGSGKGYSEDWFILNNRLFTNDDKTKYMLEMMNILQERNHWSDCVELVIVVAVRRSATTPVKNAMAFCIDLLKKPAMLCSDWVDGVLKGYRFEK